MHREAADPDPKAPDVPNVGAKLLRVAWMAILLGLAMEALLLLLSLGFGEALGLGGIAANVVGGASWSLFVCVGLAVGRTIANARLPLAGVIGALAAPVAFEVSRVLHKGTTQALVVSDLGPEGNYPILIVLVKAVEYGFLAVAIGWVARRWWGGAAVHAAVGLITGLLFGGVIIAVSAGAAPQPPTAELLSTGINEILFPVGCAMVLFSAGALGKRLSPSSS